MTNCCMVTHAFLYMQYCPQIELDLSSVCNMGRSFPYQSPELKPASGRYQFCRNYDRREGKYLFNSALGLLFYEQCHIGVTYI